MMTPVALPALTYLDWMRSVAASLGNHYEDRVSASGTLSMMQGRLLEAHSDPATPQLTIQLCTFGDYGLTADLGAGRFWARRRAGDAIIGPPHKQILLSGGSAQGIEMVVLAIDGEAVSTLCEQATGCPTVDFGPLHSQLVRDPMLTTLVEAAWRELQLQDGISVLFADTMAQLIASRLLRLAREFKPAGTAQLAPWQVKTVMELLKSRFNEELPLQELADSVGLSAFHFLRAFKSTLGVSPHQRQIALRIEQAKRLLLQPGMCVTDIALDVGYASSQSFTRAFRTVVGMTPKEYRNKHRGVAYPLHKPPRPG